MRDRIAEIATAFRYLPDAPGWRRTLVEAGWALPLMLVFAHAGGLIHLSDPPDVITLAGLAATLFVVPALGEELLFRGLLIPRDRPGKGWVALSTLMFVVWHPLQAVSIGPPWAASFLNPWFLAVVTVLGIALARIYAATRSLWPCVLIHWLAVLCWKAFLGGPF